MKESKKKVLLTEISLVSSVLLSSIVIYLLSFIEDKVDYITILNKYIADPIYFIAEGSEFLQYVLSFIVFVLSFILFRWLYLKLLKKILNNNKKINLLLYIVNTCLVILFIFLGYFIFKNKDLIYYYEILYPYKSLNIGSCIIVCITISIVFYLYYLYRERISKKILSIIKYFSFLVLLLLIGYICSSFITENYGFSHTGMHHANAYIHPIVKLFNGVYPIVDFNSLYGLYPYIYVPILKIMGSASMYNISILVSVTCFLTIFNISLFSYKIIKNKAIVLLEVIMLLTIIVLRGYSEFGGYYMQYFPHRMFFPSIMLLYSLIYLKYRETDKKKIVYAVGFIISIIAMFYNLESGIVVLGSYMSLLGYESLCKYKLSDKKLYFDILKIVLFAVVSFVIYILLVIFITLVASGELISPVDVFYGISIFFGSGYYMILMPLKHPWILLALLYAVSFATSLSRIKLFNSDNKNKVCFNRNATLFFLAIFGVLIFSYYQGRSHNATFNAVIYPGIILLGVYYEKIYELLLNSKKIVIRTFFTIIVFFITFMLTIYAFTAYDMIKNDSGVLFSMSEEYRYEHLADTVEIKLLSSIKDAIPNAEFFLSNEVFWYERYNMIDSKKLNDANDMFTVDDLKKFINYLKTENKNVIIGKYFLKLIYRRNKDYLIELLDAGYKIYINEYYVALVYDNNYNKDIVSKYKEIKIENIMNGDI